MVSKFDNERAAAASALAARMLAIAKIDEAHPDYSFLHTLLFAEYEQTNIVNATLRAFGEALIAALDRADSGNDIRQIAAMLLDSQRKPSMNVTRLAIAAAKLSAKSAKRAIANRDNAKHHRKRKLPKNALDVDAELRAYMELYGKSRSEAIRLIAIDYACQPGAVREKLKHV